MQGPAEVLSAAPFMKQKHVNIANLESHMEQIMMIPQTCQQIDLSTMK